MPTTITINVLDSDQQTKAGAVGLLAPLALSTAHQTFEGVDFQGATVRADVTEKTSGQKALLLSPSTDAPAITYSFHAKGLQTGPDDYIGFDNRYTRASLDLRHTVEDLVEDDKAATAQRIVTHTASLFEYGHADERFNAGHDEVPLIACGTARGSCVDINTYLISALRTAGIPTVYFAGYFFPVERRGVTNDMHCWVATWINGKWSEWDIAHHMKMALGPADVRPAYNPKPGTRFAITYGRGLRFDIGSNELSLSHLSEPQWVYPDGATQTARIDAHLGSSMGRPVISRPVSDQPPRQLL